MFSITQEEQNLIRDMRNLEPHGKIIIVKDILNPANYYLIDKGVKIRIDNSLN
jgi:hypothetical protein